MSYLRLVAEHIAGLGRVDAEVLADRVDQFEHVDAQSLRPRSCAAST